MRSRLLTSGSTQCKEVATAEPEAAAAAVASTVALNSIKALVVHIYGSLGSCRRLSGEVRCEEVLRSRTRKYYS